LQRPEPFVTLYQLSLIRQPPATFISEAFLWATVQKPSQTQQTFLLAETAPLSDRLRQIPDGSLWSCPRILVLTNHLFPGGNYDCTSGRTV
jgi:hypothetical protein